MDHQGQGDHQGRAAEPVVHIRLLGTFWVSVNGRCITTLAHHRRAAELVKLLALAPQRRLRREAVIETLWAHLIPQSALANLHKAASYARTSLGAKNSVVLRGGWVKLWPDVPILIDAEQFEQEASQALETGDAQRCAAAAALYGEGLLPEDTYADWATGARERLRRLYLETLRCAGQWETVIREEPSDEQAHREIIRELLRKGRRHSALRQWQQMRATLSELGIRPSQESLVLWREIANSPAVSAPVRYSPPPLIGRDKELAAARRLLQEAAAGRGGTLLVAGDVGIGKTRFCESLVTDAAEMGWTTLRGSPSPIEDAAPWAPVIEAVDRLVRQRPDFADSLSAPAKEGLARLFGQAPPSPSGSEIRGRQPIFLAVSELLSAAAAEGGAVLWIDDLHLADEATVQLMHSLARVARYGCILLVLSYQLQALRPPAAHVRASLVANQRATEIELGQLSPDAVAAIVHAVSGRIVPESTLSAVQRVVEGNPLFTEEIAATIGQDGSLHLPRRLCEIVAIRLGELEPTLRMVLQRVAVAGVDFTTTELAAVADLNQDELFDMLDTALGAGVIIETSNGFRFRHAILREVLLASMSAHHRRAAHLRVAKALMAARAAPGRVAHHLLSAEEFTAAVPWLERAAFAAAAAGAVCDARALVDRALKYAPRSPALLELRAHCAFASGEPGALGAYTEAIEVARGKRRRRLRIRQARAAVMLGDLTTATKVLDGLTVTTPAERVELLVAQGYAASAQGDLRTAERCAEMARRTALDENLAAELTTAATLRALVAHSRGEWEHQIELDLLDTSKVPQLAASIHDGHLCVVEHYLYGDHPYEELIQFARRLRDTARRNGAARGLAFATVLLGEAELLAGRLAEAEKDLREGAELHRRVGSAAGQSLALQRTAEAMVLNQRPATARELLAQALVLARQSTLLARHLLPRIYGTMIDAATDPRDALAVVDEAESAATAPGEICRMCRITFVLPAAAACVRNRELTRAEAYLAIAKEVTQVPLRGRAWHAAIAKVEAELAAAVGDAARAIELLRSATDLFTRAGQPHHARRCRAGLQAHQLQVLEQSWEGAVPAGQTNTARITMRTGCP